MNSKTKFFTFYDKIRDRARRARKKVCNMAGSSAHTSHLQGKPAVRLWNNWEQLHSAYLQHNSFSFSLCSAKIHHASGGKNRDNMRQHEAAQNNTTRNSTGQRKTTQGSGTRLCQTAGHALMPLCGTGSRPRTCVCPGRPHPRFPAGKACAADLAFLCRTGYASAWKA